MGTKTYMCLDVRGFLRNSRFPHHYEGVFSHDDGRPMTPQEAFDQLLDEVARGRHVIPCSPNCGNPCKQAGCTGFDYGPRGGCPGFSVPDEPMEAPARG